MGGFNTPPQQQQSPASPIVSSAGEVTREDVGLCGGRHALTTKDLAVSSSVPAPPMPYPSSEVWSPETGAVVNPNIMGTCIGRVSHPQWYECESLRLAMALHTNRVIEPSPHHQDADRSTSTVSVDGSGGSVSKDGTDELVTGDPNHDASVEAGRHKTKQAKKARKLLPKFAAKYMSHDPYHVRVDATGSVVIAESPDELGKLPPFTKQEDDELVPVGLREWTRKTSLLPHWNKKYRSDEVLVTFHCEESFRKIRRILNITAKEVLDSCGDDARSWYTATTIGKSEAGFFYFGHFMAKEVPQHEFDVLTEKHFLTRMVDHLEQFPHSFMTKFVFLCTVTRPCDRTSRTYIVMKNAFETVFPMRHIYDLKGSTVDRNGRDAEGRPTARSACGGLLLKDNDTPEKLIVCGQAVRELVLTQIRHDVAFLEHSNIVDYSLIVGIRPMEGHEDLRDRHQGTVDGISIQTGIVSTAGVVDKVEIAQIGFIDMLQTYNKRKRLETIAKSLVYDSSKISVVPPGEFAERLCASIGRKID
jgi:hypothetical protein